MHAIGGAKVTPANVSRSGPTRGIGGGLKFIDTRVGRTGRIVPVQAELRNRVAMRRLRWLVAIALAASTKPAAAQVVTDAVGEFAIDVSKVGFPLCILRPENLRDAALCRSEAAASLSTPIEAQGGTVVVQATEPEMPSGVLLSVVRMEWHRSDVTVEELRQLADANKKQLLSMLPLERVEERVEPGALVRGFPATTLHLDGTAYDTRYRFIAMLAIADGALYYVMLRAPASAPVTEANLFESVRISRPGKLSLGRPGPNRVGFVLGVTLTLMGLMGGSLWLRRKYVDAYDDFINKLNDQDWGWWPFVRVRPPPHEPVSTRRLAVMSLLYGSVYGSATVAVFVSLGQAPWSHLPGVVIFFIMLFFVMWGALARPSWNRRAARLGEGPRKPAD